MTDDCFEYERKDIQCYISLFSYTKSTYIKKTEGLIYPLENYLMKNDTPLGVSNELSGDKCKVTVEKGMLLVIISNK